MPDDLTTRLVRGVSTAIRDAADCRELLAMLGLIRERR